MPLTGDRPKGMVALAGMPLLARQIEVLRAGGASDINLVGGYHMECLAPLGCPVIANPAYDTTNMVESLMCARALFDGRDDLLMCYGDIVFEPRVLLAVLQGTGDVIVAADRQWRTLWSARMEDYASDVETFRLRDDGALAEIGKRPRSLDEVQAQYIGLVCFPALQHARLLAFYDGLDRNAQYDGQPFAKMYMTSFIQQLIDAGWNVRPALIDNGWLEVDTLDDLRRYHAMARQGTLDAICHLAPAPDPSALIGELVPADARANAGECDVAELASRARAWTTLAPADQQLLDRLARKIEITGTLKRSYTLSDMKPAASSENATPAQASALLAAYLIGYDLDGDARHLNTVLKALDGGLHTPRPALSLALDHACATRLREWE
jgi:Predicted sugar nucleotidyltransferases